MKKILLNSLLVITLCSSACSQSLKNTTWYVYNPSNVLTYKFHFATDTSFISTNLSTYYPLSNFAGNGNALTLYDITGAVMACPATDTGHYTFAIQNDTLLFTLVSDPCAPRTTVMTTYHWVRAETLLHNTFWNLYNPSNVLTYKFYFETDTSFISTNLSTYYPLSNFAENGNALTLYDITGAVMACPATDTGHYTFAIQNDTLLFTLVSDPCTPRTAVLTTYHWVQITAGIQTQNSPQAFQLFPNPSLDGIFNLRADNNELGFDKISVNTIQGKLILETIISGRGFIERSLNLSGFPKGIYFLTLHGQQLNKVFKLVR